VLTNTDPFRVQFDGRLGIRAWAGYGNVTYDITDRFSSRQAVATAGKSGIWPTIPGSARRR
jgi:hypothetical protein